MRKRDYKAEYQRRLLRGLAKGLTKAEARGHAPAKPASRKAASKVPYGSLHRGFELIKAGASLTNTAKSLHVSRERLKKYLLEKAEVRSERGRLVIVRDRRQFLLPMYSQGRLKRVRVDAENARLLGRYMYSVGRFLSTGDYDRWIAPFQRMGVINVQGQSIAFEVLPNKLYQLDATGELAFHQIYQTIV